MGLRKGQTNNKNGRPKGKPNKVTGELRDVISGLLNEEMTTTKLRNILRKLDPEKRLAYLIKLTDFVLPKLKQTDLNVDFENLSEEQLDLIIKRMLTPKKEQNE